MGEVSRSFLSRFFGWVTRAIWVLCQVLLIAWASLVIYFSNLSWPAARLALAVCFALISIWLLWLSRRRLGFAVFVLLFVRVVAWSVSILPSHHLPWRQAVATMPRATNGRKRVRTTGFQHFD